MPEFTTSDGVRLSYDERGSGSPLLLVAGYTAPPESWVFQTQAFVDAGHRVYTLDRRSHGYSQDTVAGQRMARHGKDLAEFLEELYLTDVVVVGGSMGASTMWACADLGPNPFVRAWVSVDQTPKMLNEDGWEHGFYGFTPATALTHFADGIPPTGRGWTPAQAQARTEKLLRELDGVMPPFRTVNAPETRHLLRDHALQDWRDVIAKVEVPMLFVAGKVSEFWPSAHAEAAAALNPRAQAYVIPGGGHAIQIDRPDVFNQVVLDFVAKLDADA